METEEEPPRIEPKFDWKQLGTLLLLILCAVFISSYLTFLYVSTRTKTQTPYASPSLIKENITSTPIPTSPSRETPNMQAAENMQLYPSPSGKLVFYIFPNQKGGSFSDCSFGLREGGNSGTVSFNKNISNLVGKDKIPCSEGMGGVYQQNFRNWIEDEKFIFDDLQGKIYIINALSLTTETTYAYNPTHVFVLVSEDLKYWLFRKYPSANPTSSYVVLNQNQEVVKDEINFSNDEYADYVLFIPLYDKVNYGIVFMTRKFRELPTPYSGSYTTEVSARFDFLSFSDLSYRTLLTTDFIGAPGRGCGINTLLSKAGEIIIKSDCLIVGNQYKDSEGNIHLKL
ncbi:hypothetical protein HY345_03995 [Candidatus Microgenomates bacterium]|nr:hypothetical protein [Candidatus Microgenomates bacterium]